MNNNHAKDGATPQAFSLTQAEIGSDIFEGVPPKAILGSTGRSLRLFESADTVFALGGFEVEIGADFNREHRYDPFPRHEYMFFTKGGMRLEGDDGTVAEAGPGEMLFIPKGWCGLRIITDEGQMQKFSIVYLDD